MCGIVGYWQLDGQDQALADALPRAMAAMLHRGPDDAGSWCNGKGVGFGFQRLAILDLSPTGHQPMHSADGRFTIIFNGEIYNFREIAEELKRKGHVFVGRGDTEVILAAYREWGAACVDRLVGMFAIAIWDEQERRLRLFRDRAGVKPLHYGLNGKSFVFGSELKALRALPGWPTDPDPIAVGEFLQYGYIGEPRSIYAGIRKLPPGHWLELDAQGALTIHRYWSLASAWEKGPLTGSREAIEEELDALLEQAVLARLVSDVPVGLFLSGGIDSSLVAGIIGDTGSKLQTFTIGFNSAEHDERHWAADIARQLGFENTCQVVDEADARAVLTDWPSLYDEPFGDASGIPTYLVARLARQSLKVVLSADGGDELFCGYSGYDLVASRMEGMARIPGWLRGPGLSGALQRAIEIDAPWKAHLSQALLKGKIAHVAQKGLSALAAPTDLDAVRPYKSFWVSGEIDALIDGGYRDPRIGRKMCGATAIEQLAFADFHEFLPDDVLAKGDRATMAASVEAREPLLDHRLVEFAFRMPLEMRMGPMGSKDVLRRRVAKRFGNEHGYRAKQGFAVPLDDWMQSWLASGAYEESVAALASKMPFLNRKALASARIAYGTTPQGRNRLWLLHVLGRWAAQWM